MCGRNARRRRGDIRSRDRAGHLEIPILAPAPHGRQQAERKDNSQRMSRTARATFRVRLETGRMETSCRGTGCAPLTRGSFFTLMRKGVMVMSRYVTV